MSTGYGEDTLPGSATPTTTTPGPLTATKRVKLQALENDDAASSGLGSGRNTPVDTSDGISKSKKGGKKKKKSKASPISG